MLVRTYFGVSIADTSRSEGDGVAMSFTLERCLRCDEPALAPHLAGPTTGKEDQWES